MPKSPNPDIINKIYFRNIYSCQRKIYWYKVKVMETINAVWEHSYGEDCIPNFSANMEQPRHRWYEFKEGFTWPNCSAYMTDAMLKNGDTDLHEINMALL